MPENDPHGFTGVNLEFHDFYLEKSIAANSESASVTFDFGNKVELDDIIMSAYLENPQELPSNWDSHVNYVSNPTEVFGSVNCDVNVAVRNGTAGSLNLGCVMVVYRP